MVLCLTVFELFSWIQKRFRPMSILPVYNTMTDTALEASASWSCTNMIEWANDEWEILALVPMVVESERVAPEVFRCDKQLECWVSATIFELTRAAFRLSSSAGGLLVRLWVGPLTKRPPQFSSTFCRSVAVIRKTDVRLSLHELTRIICYCGRLLVPTYACG